MLRTARWRPAAAALSAGGIGVRLLRPLATRSGDRGGGGGGAHAGAGGPDLPGSSSPGAPDWQVASPRWNEAARAWRPEREAASETALREAHRQLAALHAPPAPAGAALGDGTAEPSTASETGAGSSDGAPSVPPAAALGSPLSVTAACASGLEACRRVGRWVELLSLFEAMRGAGVTRDARAYEHGLTAAMVLERFDLALAIWAEMRAPAGEGAPEVEAAGAGAAGGGAAGAAGMGHFPAAPVRPTARAYNAAMSALERSGRSSEALALYGQMVAEEVAPGEKPEKKSPPCVKRKPHNARTESPLCSR